MVAGASVWAAPSWAAGDAPRRIGVLFPSKWDKVREDLVRGGISAVVGPTIPFELEVRSGEDSPGRVRAYASQFVETHVDVILAIASLPLSEARRATSSIPILALDLESDPIASGAVASLSRPGGNVTGIFFDAPEIAGKWLQFLREINPSTARVALLHDVHTDETQVRAAEASAAFLGIPTMRFGVATAADLPPAFEAISTAGRDAVLAHSSPLFVDEAARIARLALEHRLPSVMLFPVYAKAGGLLSFGPDNFALLPQIGAMVGRVLKGAHPSELPVERPSRFTLAINVTTARALDLTVPQSLLLLADEVIE
jgi:putative ABC transport system substrate-binding protein